MTGHYNSLFIDGAWVEPDGRDTIPVHAAATEALITQVPAGNDTDADKAVRAAAAALPVWQGLDVQTRAGFIARIADELEKRADELARLIAAEVGMPLKLSSRIQVGAPIAAWRNYANLAGELESEETLGNSRIVREPVGVVACITPWNYPLHQITAKVAPALLAGCTVVLKPSEVAPAAAYILAEAIYEVGLPDGVFNLVTGYGPVVGEALVRSPLVDMVSFTGSTAAGKRVSALAAESVKRVALELGGKSPAVILDDADLAKAVRATVMSCFLNSGQTCSAMTRMLVHESQYEEAAAMARELAAGLVVGDPLDPATRLGPLASAQQRDRVREYIAKGVEGGAELLTGGTDTPAGVSQGYYVQPTVFGRVDPASVLAQEEVFGPVLSIISYADEDQAVEIANGTAYGLAATVWSEDRERALRVARRIQSGQVDINAAPYNALAPFGGMKQSGLGREHHILGLHEFTEVKSIQLDQ